jgi:uncharacterized RDD family membrane protein YckC
MQNSSPHITDEEVQKWRHAKDKVLIEAATTKRGKYSIEVQNLIDIEVKQRGLWDYILYLRGEKLQRPVTPEWELEGFVCEACKCTRLNPHTGRCAQCDLAPVDFGYCKDCDRYWSIPSGKVCPDCRIKLVPFKAVSTYRRLMNSILDNIICFIILIPVFLLVSNNIRVWIINTVVILLYYVIFESIWQKTPGKFITGTKVITYDGDAPPVISIIERSLTRFFVLFEPLSFLGARVRGWHDEWTGTYVIRAKRFTMGRENAEKSSQSFLSGVSRFRTSNLAKAAYFLSTFPLYILIQLSFLTPIRAHLSDGDVEELNLSSIGFLVSTLLGLIVGFIALKAIKKEHQILRGRCLAWAAILIPVSFLFLGLCLMLIHLY